VCTVVAPKISCLSTKAAVGERDVMLTCTLDAKPRLTSLFWIIAANGTTLTDRDTDDADSRQFHARLHVRHTAAVFHVTLTLYTVTFSAWHGMAWCVSTMPCHFLSTVKTDASSFLHCPSLSADLREAQHACRGIAFTQRSKMALLKFGMGAS